MGEISADAGTDPWSTDLGREMRSVLAKLEMVSAGTTTSLGSSGGGSNDSPLPVSGDHNPPHLLYRRLFGQAGTDSRRRDVLDQAKAELAHLTGRAPREKPVGETRQERDARIAQEGEGYTVKEAAVRFRCGERDVVNARKAGDRRIDNGARVAPLADASHDRKLEEVHRLRDQGLTIRQIGMTLGLSSATVGRYVYPKKAA